MARLIDDTFSRGFETARLLLGHPKFTPELAAAIRREGGADRAIDALLAAFPPERNPFELAVEAQLDRLRDANRQEGWGFYDETFDRLAETAPPWPAGRLAFRSFRIRFYEGAEGVEQTFDAHLARIRKAFPQCWCFDDLRSGRRQLRLFAGDGTHAPAVEWIAFDLDLFRKRVSVEEVRGPDSLADEGLVFAWLFPEYVQAIDNRQNPSFLLAGYEILIPGRPGGWRRVPYVARGPVRDRLTGQEISRVDVAVEWADSANGDYAIPSIAR